MRDLCIQWLSKKFNCDQNDIDINDQFSELGITSIEFMGFVAELESEFNVTITDRELSDLFTVGDLVNILEKKNERN